MDGQDSNEGIGGQGGLGGGGGGGAGDYEYGGLQGDVSGGAGGIGAGGGGGSDYSYGGDGGIGGGGGGSGGSTYGTVGSGGGLGATDGEYTSSDAGGAGGGGGFFGVGGTGAPYSGGVLAGSGGDGGSSATGTGNGGSGCTGDADYGPGAGGGGFGNGDGGDSGGNSGCTSGGQDGMPGGDGDTTQYVMDDTGGVVYTYVSSITDSILTDSFGEGAGNDILDGGPGSDHLYGLGGVDTFVFTLSDASSGSDEDVIWDFTTGETIELQSDGSAGTAASMIAAQTTDSDHRTITFGGMTITVKDIARDLEASDFTEAEEREVAGLEGCVNVLGDAPDSGAVIIRQRGGPRITTTLDNGGCFFFYERVVTDTAFSVTFKIPDGEDGAGSGAGGYIAVDGNIVEGGRTILRQRRAPRQRGSLDSGSDFTFPEYDGDKAGVISIRVSPKDVTDVPRNIPE